MPRSISWRKLVQKFRHFGFDGPYPGGRHLFMTRLRLKVRIPHPHRGDIGKALVAKIIRQANLSDEEWQGA